MGDNPHPRASYQVSLLPPKILLNQIMSFPAVNLAVAPILFYSESKPKSLQGPKSKPKSLQRPIKPLII